MLNLYLIGMPGCGKSSVGFELEKKINKKYIDTDTEISQKINKSISEIFKLYGEEKFRDIETEVLNEISLKSDLIVATGGGIIKRKENIDLMKKSGKIIFINASVEQILKNSDLSGRPLLKDNINHIYDLYNERISIYKSASDITINIKSTIEKTANEILRYI